MANILEEIASELSLSVLRPGGQEAIVPFANLQAATMGVGAELSAREDNDVTMTITGTGQAVVTLWINPKFSNPFPLLPAFMHGANRPADTGPGYPQMAEGSCLDLPKMLSPHWSIRADRASAPLAMIFGQQGMRAAAIPPYIDGVASGLRVCRKRGVGVSIGHIVEPVQFIVDGKAASGYRGYVELKGRTEISLRIFASKNPDRRQHADVIRHLYARDHQQPIASISIPQAVKLLADALYNDILVPSQTVHKEKYGGELFKMVAGGTPGRIISEIGWTGGAMVAYPLLAMQERYRHAGLEEYAVAKLDAICDAVNPDSGFFWDCVEGGQGHCKGWWTYMSPTAHYAYNQGHACWYLMRAASLADAPGANARRWIHTAAQVLDRAIEFQLEDGRFPAVFDPADGKPLQTFGFAGCWFAAAAAALHQATEYKKYRDSARRAIEGYHREITQLTPCGTPMDTHNAADQEGNLALLHAAATLHRNTGDGKLLEILRDSADYEMLWRYYYNAQPILPPLNSAKWSSCGGSITSAHNPHIHPMQLNALDPVLYLHEQTGDDYYLQRTRDAVGYGCCCICRQDENFGWGKPGWLCERFCPSDGLLTQIDPATGTPLSTLHDYHPWTVAVTLEGLTGKAWDLLG